MSATNTPNVLTKAVKKPALKTLLGVAFVGYFALTVVPWVPKRFSYYLDESFRVVLNEVIGQNVQFGQDLIYTYGPYGLLQYPKYFPDTYRYLIAGRFFVGAAIGVGLFKIALYCWGRHRKSALFLLPLLLFGANVGMSPDSLFTFLVAIPLVVYFYIDRENPSASLFFLVAAAAFVSLVKQTFLVLSVTLMLLIAIDQLFYRRRIPQLLIAYVSCLLAFWLLAGQQLGGFAAYLINGAQIVKGFSATMGWPGGSMVDVFLYPLSVALFFGLVLREAWGRKTRFDLLPVVGLALVLFLTFKGSFVLQDRHHELQAALTTVPVACLYSAVLWPRIEPYRWRVKRFKTVLPVVLVAWVLMAANAHYILSRYAYVDIPSVEGPNAEVPLVRAEKPNYYWAAVTHTAQTLTEAATVLAGRQNLQPLYERSIADIRADNPIPELSGTTDLYPNDTAVVFAHGLPYQPRPVIQSFSAYTAELAKLNAAHLRSPNAPENILFDVGGIMRRFPSSDDGFSWPELLTRYDIRDVSGKYVVMKRRQTPREYSLTVADARTSQVNEWTALPKRVADSPIWMQIDMHPTLLGRLMSILFRLPPLYMELEMPNGDAETYRVLADVMQAGQLISPMVTEQEDFVDLATHRWNKTARYMMVKRMRLVTEGWAAIAYPRQYEVTFSELEFPPQVLSEIPGWSRFERLVRIEEGDVFSLTGRNVD